jgi:OPA family glycerol-3-phosphate transporter-like MFS transporter
MKTSVVARQWITYATFYLCRVNFAVIAPLLMSLLDFSKVDIGLISSGLLAAYAIGQFINGQLADKYAKKLLIIGMFGSAAMNFLMAFTPVQLLMFILWTINGFFQSMGWSSSVKIVANWHHPEERGKVSGILGTSYQIGNVFSWLLAGYAVLLGWTWGFIIPAILFAISGVHWTFKGKQAPEESGLGTIENYAAECDTHLGFKWTLRRCIDWKVWVGAFVLFFLNIIRYGFLTWAPTFLFELDPNITSVALKALVFPLAGSLGGLTIGLLEQKYSKITRIGFVFLVILAGLMLIYPTLESGALALAFLGGIGFLTYAPHVLTVTRLPMLFGTRKGTASVTGFIDMMGYVGATVTGIATAIFTEIGGWNMAFTFWAVGAFASAIALVLLWNLEKKKEKYM